MSLAIHCFATVDKMASRFETFSEDEICAINEAVVQKNTKDELWLVSVQW